MGVPLMNNEVFAKLVIAFIVAFTVLGVVIAVLARGPML